ncbi:Nitrilase/cyanide hydratase and apolipoprotein N-acyltransferase [Desulfovibrio sp. X2]|uniref:nitrilase-related carbon-nitrogen hydrolase n=1 Tax=Desulfovibrio sp. X2 TaxID=941449 RepID=UPI0003587FDF|nr:nitrilase-related carbon-nitrogen hydrolase [Desulfovibrio sp. X2]EPR44367.1 Nitrilase/cyanide hydratase and apolipoprotein N-acyltransferase [Desulfovibrio sp. X2]
MDIYLGACQTPVFASWDDLLPFLEMAASFSEPTLWVFPELFYGGFDYENRLAWAERSAELLVRLQDFCDGTPHALAGSLMELREGNLYNSLFLVSGEHDAPQRIYSKIHLFPGVDESRYFTPGEPCPRPAAWRGLSVGGAICFDLRYPELFRLQARQGADVFAVCGQWSQSRLPHWRRLLTARAIETQSYMLAANAVGESPFGFLPGYSCLISPWGKLLFSCHRKAVARRLVYDPKLVERSRKLFNTRETEHFQVTGRAAR